MTFLFKDLPETNSATELFFYSAPLVIAFNLEPFLTNYVEKIICNNFPEQPMCLEQSTATITGSTEHPTPEIIYCH